jgi:hypothetical protein
MLNFNEIVGTHDILFITLDSLRYDVAQQCHEQGRTPHFSAHLPSGGWELRHTPGNFTLAAHQAFFSGFLPTPAKPGRHLRPFAVRFPDSKSTGAQTCVFDQPNLIAGFQSRGYHTLCIGGVGFFNKNTPVGGTLPGYFEESHWSPATGVTNPRSTANQAALLEECVARLKPTQRLFTFINVSAIHQPNHHYLEKGVKDSLESHAAALAYVDTQMPRIFSTLQRRAPVFSIICSDHGTAYGEDGYWGHRISHPVVWNVPYAEFLLPQQEAR